jgi:predicted nucleic acid-binding protein
LSIVVDSSITLAWYFLDETTRATDGVLDRVADEGGIVPPLRRFEVANGLQIAVRRKRIGAAYCDQVFARLNQLPITLDRASNDLAWSTTILLSERHQLTVYDTAYLELANRRGEELATLDAALARAAATEGVPVLGN